MKKSNSKKITLIGIAVVAFIGSFTIQAAPNSAKTIYKKNCAACHGATGAGDGSAGKSLNPKPRNFKAGLSGFKYGTTLAKVQHTIAEGTKKGMPPWKYSFKPTQIKSVAKYVMSIATKK